MKKRLTKLKLNESSMISKAEQRGIIGGMDLVWNDEFGCYMLPEVVVYGKRPACKGCQEFDKHNQRSPGGTIVTPFGEYIFKEYIVKHDPWCPWNN